jgi:hypothetical protein
LALRAKVYAFVSAIGLLAALLANRGAPAQGQGGGLIQAA